MELNSSFLELTEDDLFDIDGGGIDWGKVGRDIFKGMIKGGITGAVGGAVAGSAAGGVGAAPGAVSGGLAGALTGGIAGGGRKYTGSAFLNNVER